MRELSPDFGSISMRSSRVPEVKFFFEAVSNALDIASTSTSRLMLLSRSR